MFIINCPYCGERDQTEFSCGGEAHIERPKQPTELSDDQWAEYLFMRKNIKGIQFEALRVIGNPKDLARKYYKDGIDEIIYVDTVANLCG